MASIIAFVLAHQSIMVGIAVGMADLIIALVPSIDSNGIFHFLYLQLKSLGAPKA